MHAISVRSYLNAGLAMTAAGAIAFAPALTPNVPQQLIIPNISYSEVHLSAVFSATDIQAFLAELANAQTSIDNTVSEIVAAPGQTIGGVLATAVALNDELWKALADATTNSALDTLIKGLQNAANIGLAAIQAAVADAAGGIVMSIQDVTTLLTSTLAGALGAATNAITAIINNPLSYDSYVTALNEAVSLLNVAPNTVWTASDVVFDLSTGLNNAVDDLTDGVVAQIDNISATTDDLIADIGTATGSAAVEAVLKAVQAVSLTPLLALTTAGAGVVYELNYAAYEVSVAGSNVLVQSGNALADSIWTIQYAVDAIASAPLDPTSYITSLGAVFTGGLSAISDVGAATAEIVKMPLYVADGLTWSANDVIQGVVNAIAATAGGLLESVGLSDGAQAISDAAGVINDAVEAGAQGISNFIADTIAGADAQITKNRKDNQAIAETLGGWIGLTGDALPKPPGWVDYPDPPASLSLSAGVTASTPGETHKAGTFAALQSESTAPTADSEVSGGAAGDVAGATADETGAAVNSAPLSKAGITATKAKAAHEASHAAAKAKAAAKAAQKEAEAAAAAKGEAAVTAKANAADQTHANADQTHGGGAGDGQSAGTDGGSGGE